MLGRASTGCMWLWEALPEWSGKLWLREVGEIRRSERFEGEAECGAFGHPLAKSLTEGDGEVAVKQLRSGCHCFGEVLGSGEDLVLGG